MFEGQLVLDQGTHGSIWMFGLAFEHDLPSFGEAIIQSQLGRSKCDRKCRDEN